jgi:hypothetical protein
MSLSGQQWVFKNITIISATTGVVADGTNLIFVGCTFKDIETGINANGISGSLTLIDSTGSNLGSLITSYDSGNAGNSIILENVVNSGNTVTLGGSVVKSGSVTGTWVHGSYVSKTNSCQIFYLITQCSSMLREMPMHNPRRAFLQLLHDLQFWYQMETTSPCDPQPTRTIRYLNLSTSRAFQRIQSMAMELQMILKTSTPS